jgi:hypothetical protein
MNFSFIICTSNPNLDQVNLSIKTIKDLEIPNYEIIVVGGISSTPSSEKIRYVEFDESVKPGWITKKKNIGVLESIYENLVIMHDYFSFDYDWYDNWVEFSKNNSWDIAANPIRGINNQRIHTDWVIYDHPNYKKGMPLPYSDWSKTKNQYISGGYFLVKRAVYLNNLLNEDLVWNQAEDVEWSLRVRNKYKIVCNSTSIVRHTKWHTQLDAWKKLNKKFTKIFGNNEWKN